MNKFTFLLVVFLFGAISLHSQPSKTVRFAYLADLHVSDVSANNEDLEASIADINNQKDINFVIFAGDITEFGSDEEILLAKSIISKLNKPYYIVAGNHDAKWSESGCNTFAKVFGYEFFDFSYGGIRFIGCNSGPNMRMAPALVPRESIIKLDSITSTKSADPLFFINHYPLDESMLNWFEVTDILKRSNVQLVLCGHGHSNRVMTFDGIPAVMGRSNLRGNKGGSAGYNIISVNGGIVDFQERTANNTKQPWFRLRMSAGLAFGSQEYPRPTFDVNKRYSSIKELWLSRDNTDIGSAALFLDGVVYYANTQGYVRALNAIDGKVLWSFKTGGKIFSSPAVAHGRVVVGCSDNYIYCLDAKDGSLCWRVEAQKSVLASPSIYKGVVYIGASDGKFRAINLMSGSLKWSYNSIKGFVESKAYVDNSGVYFGSWGSTFYALNTKNGNLLWSWTNGKGRGLSPAAVWPLKADGKIFFVTPERMTHVLDAKSGMELWRAQGGREAIGISADKSAFYVKTMQDTVIAYSTAGLVKNELWRVGVGFGYEISPSPLVSDGNLVFIPTDKGDIFAISAKNGAVVWQYKFSIALINNIQPMPGNRLLVSSMDGKLGILQY